MVIALYHTEQLKQMNMVKKLNTYYKEIETIINTYNNKEYMIARMNKLIEKVYDLGVADGFAECLMEQD